MTREDIIEILNVVSSSYQGNDSITNSQLISAINYFDGIIDYLNNEIDLCQILKWEEDVEYIHPKTDEIYKISNNNLYKEVDDEWVECYDILFTDHHIDKLRKFNKYQHERYYWKFPLVDKGYFNYCINEDVYICSSKRQTLEYQTIFTEDEIKEIEREHNVDLSFLQKECIEKE